MTPTPTASSSDTNTSTPPSPVGWGGLPPTHNPATDELLTPAEVSRLCVADPKTVLKWANNGRLNPVWTVGGHRRYRKTQVVELMAIAPATGEVIEALKKVHAHALEIGADQEAAQIGRLITALRVTPEPHTPRRGGSPAR